MVDVQVWEEDTSVDRAYTALGGETEPGATSGAARTVNASQGRRAEPCLDDHRSSSSPSDHACTPNTPRAGDRPPTSTIRIHGAPVTTQLTRSSPQTHTRRSPPLAALHGGEWDPPLTLT